MFWIFMLYLAMHGSDSREVRSVRPTTQQFTVVLHSPIRVRRDLR